MKKSTILFMFLAVTAFVVATVFGLQNPTVPENQNELTESAESAQKTTISDDTPENNQRSFTLVCSLLQI